MSAVLQPTGLRFYRSSSNSSTDGSTNQFPVVTNNSALIAAGDPVALVGGSIVALTASPISGTLNANTPIGVIQNGFNYTNPSVAQQAFNPQSWLPIGSISTLAFTNVFALVTDDPSATFIIQANGSVAETSLGAAAALGGFASSVGNPYGTSRVYLDTATISQTTNTLALKIVGLCKDIDNAWGDAFTKLIVRWNSGVHYYATPNAH